MADYQIPTANDILSYQGNPGLAAGAGTMLQPIKQNPLEGVDSTLDKIQNLHSQEAIIDYKEKIDRQGNLAKMLAETGGSVFNMKNANGQNIGYTPLPQDLEAWQKYGTKSRVLLMNNPGTYNWNPDYQKARDKADYIASIGGRRAVEYNNYNQAAQTETDPAERAHIIALRDSEFSGPGHSVEDGYVPHPYMPKLKADQEKIFSSKLLADENNYNTNQQVTIDDNGNQVATTTKRLKPEVSDIRGQLIPGTEAYNHAHTYVSDFIRLMQNNPNAALQLDRNTANLNKQLGYVDENGNPTSPHYIPPVSSVVTGPDGNPKVVLNNPNVQDLMYALHMEKNGGLQTSSKVLKDKDTLDKEGLQNENTKAETNYKKEQTKHLGDKDEKALTPQQIADQHETELVVKRVNDIFNRQYAANQGAAIDGPGVIQALRAKGYNPKDWEAFALPNGADVSDLNGIERIVTNDKGVEQRTGETERADNVMMLKNTKTGDVKLASFKKNPEKDGDPAILISMVGPREAVGNAAKSKHQYKGENARLSEEISRNEAELDKVNSGSQHSEIINNKNSNKKSLQVNIPKIDSRIMEGGKKIGIVNGKKYEIVGRDSKGGFIGVEL